MRSAWRHPKFQPESLRFITHQEKLTFKDNQSSCMLKLKKLKIKRDLSLISNTHAPFKFQRN